jgi:outer membrane biosynthesis protein TonB
MSRLIIESPVDRARSSAFAIAVALSLAVHAVLIGASRRAKAIDARPPATAPLPAVSAIDVWSGETPAAGEPSQGKDNAQSDHAKATPAGANESPPRAKTDATPDAPKAERAKTSADKPESTKDTKDTAKTERAKLPKREPAAVADAPAANAPREQPSPSRAGARANGHTAAAGASGGGPFGAEGADAKRSLGRAFLRAVPAACSGNKAWAAAADGDLGHVDIRIAIDANGKLKQIAGDDLFRSLTPGASRELVSIARSTTEMLRFGTFAIAAGDVSEGVEELRISARASTVDVPADLQGGAFGLEHDYVKGTAGFTLKSGKHIEVRVRVLKADGAP